MFTADKEVMKPEIRENFSLLTLSVFFFISRGDAVYF